MKKTQMLLTATIMLTLSINTNAQTYWNNAAGTPVPPSTTTTNGDCHLGGALYAQGGQIDLTMPVDGSWRSINAHSSLAGLSLASNADGAGMTLKGGTSADRPGTISFITTGPLSAPSPASTGPTGYMYYWYGDNGSGTTTWHNLMHIWNDGKVTIGESLDAWWENTTNTPDGYKLYVADGILTDKLKVAMHTDPANWSDFVFKKDYKLMPLNKVESYIKANKHLPDVPSAQEVSDNGIDVASMDAKLLQKIEELTLYVIQQQKEIENLKKRMNP